jgi:hypothetical protein
VRRHPRRRHRRGRAVSDTVSVGVDTVGNAVAVEVHRDPLRCPVVVDVDRIRETVSVHVEEHGIGRAVSVHVDSAAAASRDLADLGGNAVFDQRSDPGGG